MNPDIESDGIRRIPYKTSNLVRFMEETSVTTSDKDWTTTLLLSILLGALGVDRFYTGHMGLGVLKLLTGGGLGIWWLIDIIKIVTGSFVDGDGNVIAKA
jgi:TM2 domain-containing membrane protein YozV